VKNNTQKNNKIQKDFSLNILVWISFFKKKNQELKNRDQEGFLQVVAIGFLKSSTLFTSYAKPEKILWSFTFESISFKIDSKNI